MPPEIAAEPELAKYWAQRYRLFSRFDEGIKLDHGESAQSHHLYFRQIMNLFHLFTFTCIHLADSFIQSDLQIIATASGTLKG